MPSDRLLGGNPYTISAFNTRILTIDPAEVNRMTFKSVFFFIHILYRAAVSHIPAPRISRFNLSVAAAVVFCFASYARADFVSGHVYGPDNKPVPNATFSAQSAKEQPVNFKTDGAGNFSVYLDPGTYTVHSATDKTLEGVVHGYPQSAEEDIHLKRK
jgi:hypothetical protein